MGTGMEIQQKHRQTALCRLPEGLSFCKEKLKLKNIYVFTCPCQNFFVPLHREIRESAQTRIHAYRFSTLITTKKN